MSPAENQDAPGPRPLRRNRSFQFLWAAEAAATLGTEINRLAIPLTLLALTDDPTLAGLVTAVLTASMLLAQLPAGVWVDRHDRRRILLVAQAVQLLNAVVLLAALGLGRAGLVHFLVFAAVDGASRAFLGPAVDVSVRAVVPVSQLKQAFAQEEARSHAGRVLGPAVGGALYALGPLMPYLASAAARAVAWLFAGGPGCPAPPNTAPCRGPATGERAWRRRLARPCAGSSGGPDCASSPSC